MRGRAPLFAVVALGCASAPPAVHGPLTLPGIPAPPPERVAASDGGIRPCPSANAAAAPPLTPTAARAPAPSDALDDDDSLADSEEAPYENGGIDDGEPDAPRDDGAAHGSLPLAPADPRLSLSDEELRRRVKLDLASLGSLSLGTPAAGGLVNPVALRSSAELTIVDAAASWGTEETVAYLTRAVAKVYERHPNTPPLQVGHLSSRRGGPLSPHRSHQSGRDVDLGYYYRDDKGTWYRRATAANLDLERTWALVRALVTETDAEYIFINTSVQKLLKDHAQRIGEDPTWLDGLFQVGSRSTNAIVRHVHGHDTHMHVRFYNPIAAELGRRTLPYLPDRRQVERREEEGLVPYRIHKGETLAVLAKKFGTSVAAIQKANRLRNLKVVAGRTYLMPQKVVVERTKRMQSAPRVTVPARRLPPRPPATG
ncbi:MAG: penicillin-insensitive murein endopeptidase [Deltaproteobacteria bacterium]|nr:penicillin-insensitive murein endopeptidase [Deltaproteobacteria bacterium]